ncbi:alpha-L-rhamnosidase [Demequina aurantiaca]|uniref:alpha-L-rhamnosidase n=1 Tax=Demequina aurantiaca TaxID=676200 RepID=UPI0007858C37|nr:alpha-L-rhamnosidase [Demequina aurantiaca]
MSQESRVVVDRVLVGPRGGPEFVASPAPLLSWSVVADEDGWRQTAVEIQLDRDGETAQVRLLSSLSSGASWPFSPLDDFADVRLRLRVFGVDETPSEYSPWTVVRTAALQPQALSAQFITASGAPPAGPKLTDPRPTFRVAKVVDVQPGLRRAVLTSTAHGVYEATVNGVVASDEVLAPGWTAYDQRLLTQTADLTALLHEGDNVVGAEVAEGWFGERVGFDGVFAKGYDGPQSVWMHVRLEYDDGRVELVGTDETWDATWSGLTLSASIYQGERRDDRRRDQGLSTTRDGRPAFPEASSAQVVDVDQSVLRPAYAPPVRRIERVEATEITWNDGIAQIDFGQNLVGWLDLSAIAPEGSIITMRHAEVLEDGELATRPLRHAAATDSVIVGPAGAVDFAPRFTFHGFRYAEISGLPSEDALRSVAAVVVHTDMARTGRFESSNPLLNQLHSNVVWGMRGNFLSIPTDCPQRDERLGWTGDVQVFAPTATYLYDSSAMLESWLEDLALEQRRFGGVVPSVVPSSVDAGPVLPAAAWGDAVTLVPAAIFGMFGNDAVLTHSYDSMTSWLDVVLAQTDEAGLWEGGFQFGDWLDPTAPHFNPADAKTKPEIVASAYLYRSLSVVAATAERLGKDDDHEKYSALARRTKAAFLATYVTASGRMTSDAHTAYAVAISFGLLEGDERLERAGSRLAELVVAHAYRIRTGFVGTPLICDALTETGHRDVAYRLLLETECPSWLYPVTKGATTIWERWDSLMPDGSVNPGEMTSFNHYALGAVADWMHREIAGIDAARAWGERSFAGIGTVRFAPRPGGDLSSASASLETTIGRFEVAWSISADLLSVEVAVPANGEGVIDLPGVEPERVGSGTHVREVEWLSRPSATNRITLDTPLSDLVNDAAASGALMGAFAQTGYFIGLGWSDGGKWRPDFTLRNGLPMIKSNQWEAVAQALGGLNAARGFEPIPGEWDLSS